jgi:hypothetical protein
MSSDRFDREDDAEVGYRNPPRSARFQKGKSGNPMGRPKGSKNKHGQGERLRQLMLMEAYRPVKVAAEDSECTMPLAQAVLRSLGEAAAKGEARAQATFLRMVSASEVEEELLDKTRDEEGVSEEPTEIVYQIVDAANGRPTGKTELIYPDDPRLRGGNPEPTRRKDR